MSNGKSWDAELLLDERWIAKRNKILERDKYHCVQCFPREDLERGRDKEFFRHEYGEDFYQDQCKLVVHHKRYLKGRRPWEYDNGYLITLCEGCHDDFHESVNLEEHLDKLRWDQSINCKAI